MSATRSKQRASNYNGQYVQSLSIMHAVCSLSVADESGQSIWVLQEADFVAHNMLQ